VTLLIASNNHTLIGSRSGRSDQHHRPAHAITRSSGGFAAAI
jgi:hypothetical protein